VQAIAANLQSRGWPVTPDGGDVITRDPWGTQLRLRSEHS
jgi:hypothetical protein